MEPQVELRLSGGQPVARDIPATGGFVDVEARGELLHGSRREVGTPAWEGRQDGGIDPDDIDPPARSGGTGLVEDRDGGDSGAELGVPVDRHDRRGDRQTGPELGDPQVQP